MTNAAMMAVGVLVVGIVGSLTPTAEGFGPRPPPPPGGGCTKAGCWFSFTNYPGPTGAPVANSGRCGEVDAAQGHMPNDIWRDTGAVGRYVGATIAYFRPKGSEDLGIVPGRCNRDPLQWYRKGSQGIQWESTSPIGFSELCSSKGCTAQDNQADDPKQHQFCSLCGGKPYNGKANVQFWYPRANTQNLAQFAQNCSTLTTLSTALAAGSLLTELASPGPFTVFAPANSAFAKIPALVLKALLNPKNIKELDSILELHVVAGKIFSKDLKDGQFINTLGGGQLTVTITDIGQEGQKVFIGSTGTKASMVIAVDNGATNGVVHVLDTVLVPSLNPGKNIVETAAADPDLSTLVTALKAAGLVDTLSGNGPFTVFAPTNEAFDNLPAGVLANLLLPQNKAQLIRVLTYHVVAGAAVLAKDLKDGENVKTVEGDDVKVRLAGKAILINSAEVTTADVGASNGVVHIIDGVLLPPAGPPTPAPPPSPPKPTQTIVDLAAADPDFSTLVTALKAAGLVDTLNGPGPFTVLAPTNKAFDTLPAGALANLLKPENKAALVSLLTYHVLPGSLDNFTRNGNKQQLTTLPGSSLRCGQYTRQISTSISECKGGPHPRAYCRFLDGNRWGDGCCNHLAASNGLIYTLGSFVLTPPAAPGTIVDIAAGSKDLTTLVAALKAGSLIDTLNSTYSTFTVFAPTNEAFANLPAGVLTNLLLPQNKEKLVDVLTYHVVKGKYLAGNLTNGETLTTIEGKKVTVTLSAQGVQINEANVLTADVAACNGVVHIIGGVLLPTN